MKVLVSDVPLIGSFSRLRLDWHKCFLCLSGYNVANMEADVKPFVVSFNRHSQPRLNKKRL